MIRPASLALFLICTGFAQPSFEVASIKPANPDAQGGFVRLMPGGGLNLITQVYGVRAFQVARGPGWGEQIGLTVWLGLTPRGLLADRFQMVVHTETKEHPIYVLAVSKNGAKCDRSCRKLF